jgi:hypothetical protein
VNLVTPPPHKGSPIRGKGVAGVSYFQRYEKYTNFVSINFMAKKESKKKRKKKYEPKVELEENVSFEDLINVGLKYDPKEKPEKAKKKSKK